MQQKILLSKVCMLLKNILKSDFSTQNNHEFKVWQMLHLPAMCCNFSRTEVFEEVPGHHPERPCQSTAHRAYFLRNTGSFQSLYGRWYQTLHLGLACCKDGQCFHNPIFLCCWRQPRATLFIAMVRNEHSRAHCKAGMQYINDCKAFFLTISPTLFYVCLFFS